MRSYDGEASVTTRILKYSYQLDARPCGILSQDGLSPLSRLPEIAGG